MTSPTRPLFVSDGKNAIHEGIEHEPGGGKALLDPTDALFLLLDHQSGLFQNVKDISITELRANTTALAKLAARTRGFERAAQNPRLAQTSRTASRCVT